MDYDLTMMYSNYIFSMQNNYYSLLLLYYFIISVSHLNIYLLLETGFAQLFIHVEFNATLFPFNIDLLL